jgi:hypothetical protein
MILPCTMVMREQHVLSRNSVALVHERTIPTERPPRVSEVSVNLGGRGRVITTDAHGRILGFLDWTYT